MSAVDFSRLTQPAALKDRVESQRERPTVSQEKRPPRPHPSGPSSLAICYRLSTIGYRLIRGAPITFHVSRFTLHVSRFTFHACRVTRHLSRVTLTTRFHSN